jgi:ABC-type oligopeptide transport system ATPase subunit
MIEDAKTRKILDHPEKKYTRSLWSVRSIEQGMKSEILPPPFPEYTELLLSSVPEMDPDW